MKLGWECAYSVAALLTGTGGGAPAPTTGAAGGVNVLAGSDGADAPTGCGAEKKGEVVAVAGAGAEKALALATSGTKARRLWPDAPGPARGSNMSRSALDVRRDDCPDGAAPAPAGTPNTVTLSLRGSPPKSLHSVARENAVRCVCWLG